MPAASANVNGGASAMLVGLRSAVNSVVDGARSGRAQMLARYQQSPGIEFAPLQDEVILFHSPSNKFCVLNRTSSFIWSELKQPASSEEIAGRLEASFSGVGVSAALSDVDTTLREMLALGLIVRVDQGTDNRKEV
jgi:Coenzyme PQQ synthesis protein D (PqqD)